VRSVGLGVVCALTAVACSGGGDGPVTQGTAAPIDDAGDGAAGGSEAPDATAPVTAPPVDADGRVALPGLVDATDDAIPNDSAVRTGTLANGLQYYVRQNGRPGAKADLRLAIRAGSVDELGDTTGVAHFVEHMLFNGTEQFPENELIDVLRSFGASFGADINAYTSFDETVYSLNVPNDDESVELGLTVLDEWLSHATFDPARWRPSAGSSSTSGAPAPRPPTGGCSTWRRACTSPARRTRGGRRSAPPSTSAGSPATS
jgi:zinc protease